jgi:site-specific recombinase
MILWASAGIVLIGWLTLVSFTLSMSLAFRSRNIPLTEFWAVGRAYAGIFGESRYHSFPREKKTASGKTP